MISIELPADWTSSLQRLGLPTTINFYQNYCHPLVRDRIKDIIKTSWEKTVATTHAEIKGLLTNAELIWSGKLNQFMHMMLRENLSNISYSLNS